MLMSYENQIQLEIRFRKNLAKLKGSALRIKSVFPAGEANFGQAMHDHVSVPRKVSPGHPGWI